MRTRDVDWAIRIGKFYIHVSSAGDDLPAAVQENLYDIWDALKSAPVLYKAEDVELNEVFLKKKFPANYGGNNEMSQFQREWYIHSFKSMAMRGFYSFDRDISTPVTDSKYNLIAWPKAGPQLLSIRLLTIHKEIDISQLCQGDLVAKINDLWNEENNVLL